MVSPTDVRRHTMSTMAAIPVSGPTEKNHNGQDFYKYFFAHHPEVRKYFKGAENFTADDVGKSDRFDKLGNAILLSVHILTQTADNDNVFRGFIRDMLDRHISRGLDPALWKAFVSIWNAYMESKGITLNAEQKEAWNTLSARFNEECQKYLAQIGQPHL
ncbi:unnamed protein product [Cylicocyclus nassatus]|uniref:Globin domain-containing protein n=1 Tax=Cylicocyclus nassatus TaxID=53992 RepID=A0AA36DN18_CYLNA|nr:unnamed protein product [Cylicocyclus nassatus]